MEFEFLEMVNYLSKKEKKQLITLVSNVNIKDEDSVWDMAVELGKWSVKLRASILSSDD